MSEHGLRRQHRRDWLRRRDFLSLAVGALAAPPGIAVAQQPPKQPRIAVAIPAGNPDQIVRENGFTTWSGLLSELRRLGYVEGTNIVVERYSAEGRSERYDEFVGDIVRRAPTLILTAPNQLALLFAKKTNTIPIVAIMADPIAAGIVTNLAHPGSNLTGVSTNFGREIWGKRLQLMKEALPAASKIAYLALQIASRGSPVLRPLELAGERLGMSVTPLSIAQATEAAYRETFAAIGSGAPDAIIVSEGAEVTPHRPLIAELAIAHRIPTMFPYRGDIERGALMAYGGDQAELGRRMAGQVAKILAGANPAEIPIEQANRLLFLINLRTAGAIGFIFPPAVFAQADEVIE
jgi:putative ABC transport system substrate-binding protein